MRGKLAGKQERKKGETRVDPELRTNIYQLLDEVLRSGLPIEVKLGDRKLRIVPIEKPDKLQNLVYRPEVIQGDPEDLVSLSWDVQ